MDDTTKRLLHRLIRRTSTEMLKTTLGKWGRLTMAQRQSLDFTQSKSALTEELLTLCEKNGWTVKNVAELEMIHVIDNPNQGMWHAYRLMDPEDDACSVELTQFKERFKTHLSEVVRHVSVKTKKHTDEAVWIRIAWGDTFSRPNHLKPTYVVYHLQTPYVFVTSLTSKQKPLLSQALILSTRYQGFKDANLSGRKLTAIRDLLMKQYPLVFPTNFSSPVAEKDQTMSNPCIIKEQDGLEAKRLQMARGAFGDGVLPQLESAVYKLETKFKDQTNRIMTEREEPFRCVVKFTSTNLLESFRQCAASGIVSPPITPLFSSIPLKGKNYFALKDKTLGSSP
ncbi:centromere protein N [Mastacembelus armatus]|uniref:Centromere protein N n=1 Tax=Mastacembelus armatus TaxID=205130 RepID=A0A3Q3N4Z9_9TELE|nr:centromere protein N [Mastacembelus armatus]